MKAWIFFLKNYKMIMVILTIIIFEITFYLIDKTPIGLNLFGNLFIQALILIISYPFSNAVSKYTDLDKSIEDEKERLGI